MMNRKHADLLFRQLIGGTALVSILALGAILLFVFAQGAAPFFVPSAPALRLVPQRIGELTVNGTAYCDHSSFIEIPKNVNSVVIGFPEEGKVLELAIDPAALGKNSKAVSFIRTVGGEVSSPESYVYTVRWPGQTAALDRKLHIILPEPPYGPGRFLFGLEWKPVKTKLFGIFPMIAGTILTSLGAILLGVPLALFCALFMAEFLPIRFAAVVRAGVELLAGIPSVVYGFFGLMVIVPAVKNVFRVPSGNTFLSASLVLALMILPTVIAVAETSLRAVPAAVREASLSLGASKMQTAWRAVLPHAHSGVSAGIILGISRAVGETMAVILVAGNSPQLVKTPLESLRTLTATIAMEMGYASGRHGEMLFSIGAVLFSMILILNGMILNLRRRLDTGKL
jgi:phosphate transport system permease protein